MYLFLLMHTWFLSSLYIQADIYLTNAQEQSNSFLCFLWKHFQCIEQTVDVMHFSAFSQSHSHSGARCPPAGLSDCFPAVGQQPTDRCIRSLMEWI